MIKRLFITGLLIGIAWSGYAQWPSVQASMRPWTRWWWMGNAVDSTGINSQLQAFAAAGIGGVEIVPIYGAVGAESRYIPYLSPQWIHMLDITTRAATARNMGVYLAVGSGWPIGGPQVSEADAASKLIVQQYTLEAGKPFTEKILLKDPKQQQQGTDHKPSALSAYDDKGRYLDLTGKVLADGTLDWKAPAGRWKLYAAFSGKTRQKVKRAAPGGEGYTLDHFSKTAVTDYLDKFDEAIGKRSHGVAAFYNDSYEVFNADWTPSFFEAFRQKRGYDLRQHLDLLVSDAVSDSVARIKSDYRQTMSELMIDGFSASFHQWSHNKQALSLNQAHGSPANLLDLYAGVDIPETESFGATHFDIKGLRRDSSDYRNVDPEPVMMQFASSAAHVMGHPMASSETFTWLSEHFKTTWAQCRPEAENLFLAGINHIFFHGSTYSPAAAPWPGWLFYASVEMVPANSLWPHIRPLNDYITRCQSILQSGQPDNEIMLYWPVYDAWNQSKGMDFPFRVHDIDRWLQPTDFYKQARLLQSAGYSVDFVSDSMIVAAFAEQGRIGITAKGSRSKVLVVPACSRMPAATFEALFNLAKQGATVVIRSLPEGVPGLLQQDRQRLEALKQQLLQGAEEPNGMYVIGKGHIILNPALSEALPIAGLSPESLVSTGLQFIRRQHGNGKYYYLVNHTGRDIDTTIELQDKAAYVQYMDAASGRTGNGRISHNASGNLTVRVQLLSGQSLILKTTATLDKGLPQWYFLEAPRTETPFKNSWKLTFGEGGPVKPADTLLKVIQPWTLLAGDSYRDFSGQASYSQSFDLEPAAGREYLLELPQLYESAHVWINGKDAGYIWSVPYQLPVTALLQNGSNTIRIEVANLMANRIRYMDRNKISWRNYHEINFVNINYKSFDASDWPVAPSGIAAPVILKTCKKVP